MPVFVALLRGVNVGKAKRVPMAELRTLLAGLGHSGVVTLLNSGNAVFRASQGTAAQHAANLSAALLQRLNVDVPVIVKSAKEMDTIVAECALKNVASDPSRLLVAFMQSPKTLSSLAAIEKLVMPPERFAMGSQAAYLWCPQGILESKAGTALLGKIGTTATTRNWATVLKLQYLAQAST